MAVAADPRALRVEPSLEEVRELAREHNLVALRHTFIDDLETPVSAFLKLRGRDPQFPAFLLESAEQGQQVGRYSFIGWRPKRVIRWSLADGGDPYTLAGEAVSEVRQAEIDDLPIDEGRRTKDEGCGGTFVVRHSSFVFGRSSAGPRIDHPHTPRAVA